MVMQDIYLHYVDEITNHVFMTVIAAAHASQCGARGFQHDITHLYSTILEKDTMTPIYSVNKNHTGIKNPQYVSSKL